MVNGGIPKMKMGRKFLTNLPLWEEITNIKLKTYSMSDCISINASCMVVHLYGYIFKMAVIV